MSDKASEQLHLFSEKSTNQPSTIQGLQAAVKTGRFLGVVRPLYIRQFLYSQ